jgi:hypothetical protein
VQLGRLAAARLTREGRPEERPSTVLNAAVYAGTR